MENYYKKLGVSRFASKQEIRRAYIEILKTYHPDVYKGDINYAQKITADANIAFEFLSNPVKKLELDEYLQKMELEELNKKTTSNNSKQNQSNTFKTNQTYTKSATQSQNDFSNKNTQTQHSKPKFKFDFFAKRTDKSKANNKKQTKNVANDNVIKKQVKEKISNRQGDMGRLKLNALIGLIIVAILALIIVLIVVI